MSKRRKSKKQGSKSQMKQKKKSKKPKIEHSPHGDQNKSHQEKNSCATSLFIDINSAVEDFSRSILTNDRRSYSFKVCVLNNILSVIQLSVVQISIAALPNSPIALLVLLILNEVLFFGMTAIPFLLHFEFISKLEFLSKASNSVILTAFFVVCLLIASSSAPGGLKNLRPVSRVLQELGITVLIVGLICNYVFICLRVYVTVKELLIKYCASDSKNRVLEKQEKIGLKRTPKNGLGEWEYKIQAIEPRKDKKIKSKHKRINSKQGTKSKLFFKQEENANSNHLFAPQSTSFRHLATKRSSDKV